METIGLLGGIALALSSFPIAISAFQRKPGPPFLTTLLVVIGAACLLAYEVGRGATLPPMLNLSMTFLCWGLDLIQKIRGKI